MKTQVDLVGFRQSLLQLLEVDPPHEEKLLAKFEAEKHESYPLYSSILHILTHLNFSETEARGHWRRIHTHRDRIRKALGRDVGLRVAVLDYFVNVNRELKNPTVIEISIYERTARSAVTDGLTGLFDHAYLLHALRREVHRARRHGLNASLAMLDLDDFKKINDSRGHVEGDRVLMKVAAVIRENLREIDTAARYGGEEFAVILPDTHATGAYVVADRIRGRIEEQLRRRGPTPITISGGVATFPDDASTDAALILKADEGLYRAKAAGKNRIVLAQGERRRHVRVPATHPVTLSARTGKRAAGRTRNVSESGLLVSLREPVAVGSAVSLVIRPSGGKPVGLRGEVVRVEKVGDTDPRYEVGLRFLAEGTGIEGTGALLLLHPAGTETGGGT